MSHTRRLWTLTGGGLALFVLLAAFLVRPAAAGPVAQESDTTKLQNRVQELEGLVARQQQRLDGMERLLMKVTQLTDGLVAGAQAIGSAADKSRKNGFEAAGANSQAKTDLLDGLLSFAATVEKARIVKASEDKKSGTHR